MSSRLKLVIAYDGAPFAGWQSQAHGRGVQDHLEHAFRVITRRDVRVHGAGRTDAGVHALGQTAHVELPDRSFPAERWTSGLNGCLVPAIRVLSCRYVPSTFHARFSARGKLYRYRIWNDRILPPLEVGRAWLVAAPLDFEVMTAEARSFLGRHDFASFAANRGKPVPDTVRTIDALRLRRSGRGLTIAVSGDGFLYRMVRMMVGALVRVGRDPNCAGEIRERLRAPGRATAAARFAAPAGGLFLIRVRY